MTQHFQLYYFCKISGQAEETPCHHASCQSDPAYRTDDDTLIAMATTCSNRELALHAEVTLRKRYPSRKARKAIRDAEVEKQ